MTFLPDSLAVTTHGQVLVCVAAVAAPLLGLGGLESVSTEGGRGFVSGLSSGWEAVICLMAALGLRSGFAP